MGLDQVSVKNIVPPALQSLVGGGFILDHGNAPVLIVTVTGGAAPWSSDAVTPIVAGIKDGQLLTIYFHNPPTKQVTVLTGGNCDLEGNFVMTQTGSKNVCLAVWWDATNSVWRERYRTPGYSNTNSGANSASVGISNVASGADAFAQGNGCTASGANSSAMGNGCLANNTRGHAEGSSNTASGTYGAHAEGTSCTASGDYGSHAEGNGSSCSGNEAHAEGYQGVANGEAAHAEGYQCGAYGKNTHAQGRQASASLHGEHAQSGGQFAAKGDAQFCRVCLRKNTTDATLTELFLDGVDDRLTLATEYAFACKVTVVGRQDTGADHFMGTYHVLIERTGSTTALVGAVDIIYENNAGGWGAGGGLPVEITANDANNALAIKVEGLAAHNIRWHAIVEMNRVAY